MRRDQPNILLILSDQEQHPSLLPAELERPGFEWLLAHGTSFTRHHVVTLACGPSRSVIYTGQHTPHTGVMTNPGSGGRPGMSASVPTIGTMLREHGYYTAYKGKWHVSVIEQPTAFTASTVTALEPYGFAEYTADGDPVGQPWDGFRHDPAVASDAGGWLLGRSGCKPADSPWFLAVNFVNPHDVMFFDATGRMETTRNARLPVRRLPEPLAPPYGRSWDVPLPASFNDDLSAKPSSQRLQARVIEAMLGELPHDDEEAWRALRSYYLNCLLDLDRSVDALLRALVASGHDRDTVVIYSTDHGEAAGAHGMREKPTSLYREVVNVPLVVVHPDSAGGTQTAALSSAVDLVPTMLGFAGVKADERAERHPDARGLDQGVALADPRSAGPRCDRGVLFCMDRPPARSTDGQPPPRSSMRGVFDGRWKFARYFAAGDERDSEQELYDTVTDPSEMHNLASDPSCGDHMLRLRAALDQLVESEID